MVCLLVLLAAVSGVQAVVQRDVPLGECHGCEVTCFEDCVLKFDREIIQMDSFLQVEGKPAKLTEQYSECLQEDQCPCKKEEAKAAAKGKKALLQTRNATCAVGEAPCAQKCSQKVVSKAHASLAAHPAKKQSLLQRDYPIHSVSIGTFAKGAMNLDQCFKFCLAATCGCNDSPGLKTIDALADAIKANDAVRGGAHPLAEAADGRGAVVDTHFAWQFRPAKVDECAKGMIGKKVSSGLYVDFAGGVGGEVEICSDEMLTKMYGPGDHSKQAALCKSQASDDAKWGCVWSDAKGFCMVGFSPNMRCQVRYVKDPSKL